MGSMASLSRSRSLDELEFVPDELFPEPEDLPIQSDIVIRFNVSSSSSTLRKVHVGPSRSGTGCSTSGMRDPPDSSAHSHFDSDLLPQHSVVSQTSASVLHRQVRGKVLRHLVGFTTRQRSADRANLQ